jgi:hypothetical protein
LPQCIPTGHIQNILLTFCTLWCSATAHLIYMFCKKQSDGASYNLAYTCDLHSLKPTLLMLKYET